jgi:hypothetical protein
MKTRANGKSRGRSSLSQSRPFLVQVSKACSSLSRGSKPWTATTLPQHEQLRFDEGGLGPGGRFGLTQAPLVYWRQQGRLGTMTGMGQFFRHSSSAPTVFIHTMFVSRLLRVFRGLEVGVGRCCCRPSPAWQQSGGDHLFMYPAR